MLPSLIIIARGLRFYGKLVGMAQSIIFGWDSSNKSNSNSVLWQGPGYFTYWEKHKRRAKYSGRYYLEKLISKNLNEDSVSLIGHSLGARVLFFGLRDWSSSSRLKPESVFFVRWCCP